MAIATQHRRANIHLLRITCYCVGCFEMDFRKILTKAPKIGERLFISAIVCPAEFSFADLLFFFRPWQAGTALKRDLGIRNQSSPVLQLSHSSMR